MGSAGPGQPALSWADGELERDLVKKPAALGWFGNCAKHIGDLTRFSKIVFCSFKESALKLQGFRYSNNLSFN